MRTSSAAVYDDATTGLLTQILRYVRGRIPLEEFRTWFAPKSWEHLDQNLLYAQVELALAELTSNHASEAEGRVDLNRLVESDGLAWGVSGTALVDSFGGATAGEFQTSTDVNWEIIEGEGRPAVSPTRTASLLDVGSDYGWLENDPYRQLRHEVLV